MPGHLATLTSNELVASMVCKALGSFVTGASASSLNPVRYVF